MADRSTLSELSVVVSDLLGRDNLTSRAEDWLNMALAEIYTQASGITTKRVAVFQFQDGTSVNDVKYEIQDIPNNIVSIASLEFLKSVAGVCTAYAPLYLPPQTFFQTASWKHSNPTFSYPRHYTIERTGTYNSFAPGTDARPARKITIYTDPGLVEGATTTWWGYMTYVASPLWTANSDECMECTPHWEWVLIWKAAAIGAKAIHHRAVDIFEARAMDAMTKFYEVENQRIDSAPFMQGELGDPTQMGRFRVNVPEGIPEVPVGPSAT